MTDGSFEEADKIPEKLGIFLGIPQLSLEFVDNDVLEDFLRNFAYFKNILLLQFFNYFEIVVHNFFAIHPYHFHYL